MNDNNIKKLVIKNEKFGVAFNLLVKQKSISLESLMNKCDCNGAIAYDIMLAFISDKLIIETGDGIFDVIASKELIESSRAKRYHEPTNEGEKPSEVSRFSKPLYTYLVQLFNKKGARLMLEANDNTTPFDLLQFAMMKNNIWLTECFPQKPQRPLEQIFSKNRPHFFNKEKSSISLKASEDLLPLIWDIAIKKQIDFSKYFRHRLPTLSIVVSLVCNE